MAGSIVPHHRGWKTPLRPTQRSYQSQPIEAGARVLFAAGGHVFVPGHIGHLIAQRQFAQQQHQLIVLRGLEPLAFQAFEFDPDREVVARTRAPAQSELQPPKLVVMIAVVLVVTTLSRFATK